MAVEDKNLTDDQYPQSVFHRNQLATYHLNMGFPYIHQNLAAKAKTFYDDLNATYQIYQ